MAEIFILFIIFLNLHQSLSFLCPTNGRIYDENINFYHLCLQKGEQSVRLMCPKNTGFLQNEKYTGCVPFDNWQCTNKEGKTPPDCSILENFDFLHPHANPNYFWICPQSFGTKATLIKCPDGTAFNNSNESYGCVQWSRWRCSDRKKFDEL